VAQVSCANPDDLCTGDPCVIGTVTVATPCQIDFGNRTLEIAGTLRVPDGGTLDLTAATVRVLGRIDGRGDGSGAVIVLVAGTGSAVVDGTIDVRGATGGGVRVDGRTGVTIDDKIRASGKTGSGGLVNLRSAAGNVLVRRPIDVHGTSGGTIRLTGPSPSVMPRWTVHVGALLDLSGRAGNGGSLEATGPNVYWFKKADLRGKGGDGGTVRSFAFVSQDMLMKVVGSGSANGGTVELLMPPAAAARIHVSGKIDLRGQTADGGSVLAFGPEGWIALGGKVDLRGAATGGRIAIEAGQLIVGRTQVRATGEAGGGEIRLQQTGAADMALDGTFDARTSGVIAVTAPTASLTVGGIFRAGPAGCVGISAGGTLDTTAVDSDVTLAASCP
jgi:hypothetical protein